MLAGSNPLISYKTELTFHSPEIQVQCWESGWGREWSPRNNLLIEPITLESKTGRSSGTFHPFITINDNNFFFVLAIAWSGNWKILIERQGIKRVTVKVEFPQGITDYSGKVFVGTSDINMDEASASLIETFRKNRNRISSPKNQLLIEWNHWWPYRDVLINEETFLANVKVAAEAGIEVAVLDAGWFGSPNLSNVSWEDYRGDWDQVNLERFPSGLQHLADETRRLGLEFGIWIEIETVGKFSKLRTSHSEFLSDVTSANISGGASYICLANPAASAWAFQTIRDLIIQTKAVWLKLDFNIDPLTGCTRTDHGHSRFDGAFRHISSLYKLISDLKKAFPNLIIENCSSGGLRWDYGMAAVVDLGFASDQDWPAHALNTFWASSQFFPIEQLLGWCDSEWLNENPLQTFIAADSNLTQEYFDLILTISLMGGFGLSQKLTSLPDWAIMRIKFFTNLYKLFFRPRYKVGSRVHRLTAQPIVDPDVNQVVQFILTSISFAPIHLIFNLGSQENLVAIGRIPEPTGQLRGKLINLLDPSQIFLDGESEIALKPNSAAILVQPCGDERI